MRFKVEYEVEMTEEEAVELATEEDTYDEYKDDPISTTEDNLQNTIIVDSNQFSWPPDKVKVNIIP